MSQAAQDHEPDGTEDLWFGYCSCGTKYSFTDAQLRETHPEVHDVIEDDSFTTACPECDSDVDMYLQRVQVIPASAWTILPPAKGLCQICGYKHEPWLPHDLKQIYYQTTFRQAFDRRPTWHDAMLHCAYAVRIVWVASLAKHDVFVPPYGTDPERINVDGH